VCASSSAQANGSVTRGATRRLARASVRIGRIRFARGGL
jgi:hypothetical protein